MWTIRLRCGACAKPSAQLPSTFPLSSPLIPALRSEWPGIHLHDGVRVIEPLGYLAFLGLMARARMVLTDSGGIQEETTVLHVPCLTLRQNTERPITCELGTNILVGIEPSDIVHHARRVLNAPPTRNPIPEKWDGRAGERIVDVLLAWLRLNRAAPAAQRTEQSQS